MADSIVMYFSHAGENYFGGTIKRIEKGNTAVVAEMLAEMTESIVARDFWTAEPPC